MTIVNKKSAATIVSRMPEGLKLLKMCPKTVTILALHKDGNRAEWFKVRKAE